MYIIFLFLCIIIITILIVLGKLIILFKSYEKTTAAFVEIFKWLRKRHEHLDEAFPYDLDILSFYAESHALDLKERIIAELALPIIDDECNEYREKAITAIMTYQVLYLEYTETVNAHPHLRRLLALEELLDLSDLDFSQDVFNDWVIIIVTDDTFGDSFGSSVGIRRRCGIRKHV